jgi:hypothetical protein
MEKAKIYTLPKNYIERQRIIKALQYPPYELVMWYYHTSEEGKENLFGVYLTEDNSIHCYYYDIETLNRQGRGYNPEKPPDEQYDVDAYDIYRWLHKKNDITDLLGFVLGVQSRPPKLESKIIQFPVIKVKCRKKKVS